MTKESSQTIDEMIQNKVNRLSLLIDSGEYEDAYKGTLEFLQIIEIDDGLDDKQRFLIIFNNLR